MLTILYEWKNSLTLFKKDTLLLILYSWYKLTVQVYKDLFVHFWWLIIPIPGFLTYNYINRDDAPISTAVGGILFITMYYIVILLARPTLEKKDIKYVINKGLRYVPSVVGTYILYLLFQLLGMALVALMYTPFIGFNWNLFACVSYTVNIFRTISFFLWVWILLFLLDSKGSVRDCFNAVSRGYKMVLFNTPISVFLATFLAIGYYALALLNKYFSIPFQEVQYLVVFPIAITLIVTIYIKRVHDQCNLYFGRGNA